MSDKAKCTLTDVELLEACHKAISNQCTKQRWQMTVPPDMDRDSDMLLSELCNRYEKACKEPALGNATTGQLLNELRTRIELNHGGLDYKTVEKPLTMRSLPETMIE